MKPLPKSATLLSFFDPPHANGRAREQLDLALALAAADWPLALFFGGPGVLLLTVSEADDDDIRDFPAALATLELFGVEEIYAEEGALRRYGLAADSLRIGVTPISAEHLRVVMGRQACLS